MSIGYTTYDTSSYENWKSDTLGLEFDVDGSYGCQCWDYVSDFYYSIGWGTGYPVTGVNHYASECWSNLISRNTNTGVDFEQINYLISVKKGDIIVLDGNVSNPPGHIAFADEDYDGTGYLWCIGQNQGGTPLPGGGTAVTRNHLGMSLFLGAFRYKPWQVTPTPSRFSKHRFPWVLYSRKLRARR